MYLEAEANKAARKYDNASIDHQVEFYKKEGLTPYTEAKLPITSGNGFEIKKSQFFSFLLSSVECFESFGRCS